MNREITKIHFIYGPQELSYRPSKHQNQSAYALLGENIFKLLLEQLPVVVLRSLEDCTADSFVDVDGHYENLIYYTFIN